MLFYSNIRGKDWFDEFLIHKGKQLGAESDTNPKSACVFLRRRFLVERGEEVMDLYCYQIAGISLTLESPFELIEDTYAPLFRTDREQGGQEADITVTLEPRDELEEMGEGEGEGLLLGQGVFTRLYRNPNSGANPASGLDSTGLSLVTLNRLNGKPCLQADFPEGGAKHRQGADFRQGGARHRQGADFPEEGERHQQGAKTAEEASVSGQKGTPADQAAKVTTRIRLQAEVSALEYACQVCNLWPAMDLPYQLLRQGVLVLHAAAVEINGAAVLFTAPSGGGKSTQAALWDRYRGAIQLNGDKVAISCRDGQIYAWGLPFCGTSGICRNYCLPIRAIALVSQGKENRARRLTGIEALAGLMNNAFGHNHLEDCRNRLLDCLSSVIQEIPVFGLTCRPDRGAVDCLAHAMEEYRK